MVGADLANLVNEAALLAARRNHEKVQMDDFTDALEKIVLGAERQIMLSDEDKARIAYHEAGHAIVGMLTPGADPVRKVSIIPRGMALGVTLASPTSDRSNYAEDYLRTRIKVALGGRVAEELVFDSITTGAESDIQQLTEIARHMVGALGHERRGRADRGASRRTTRSARFRAPPGRVRRHAAADRRRGAADRRRPRTPRSRALLTENRDKLDSLAKRCSSTRRSTRPTPTRPRASSVCRTARPSRRRSRRSSVGSGSTSSPSRSSFFRG